MNIRSLLVASFSLVSWSTIASAPSIGLEYAGLTDNLSNATVGVLSQLGYDCQTASVGGIICKKCQVEDNKQKCQAFICDAVTKKCRRRSAEIPQVPGLGGGNERDSNDGINLPSL
ncbi:MAG: hypothetical protein AAGA16_03110 [Cyanobacteria bacterium P01_E01_bin.35]